ncbi:LiaF domain-containing protein [Pedobacter sp. Du54]|uniref:LiaF transmembrane domain-containing protein n=1 Tax=Pedobacter anseongensis TaxID=3133439 RepID=UPI0030A98DB2
MENYRNKELDYQKGKVLAGLIIVLIGSLILIDNFGFDLPSWVMHWSNLLIIIGLFIGVKHNFRNSAWFILVLIGSIFTLKEAFGNGINFGKIIFPSILVILGLYILFKPKTGFRHKARWKQFNQPEPFTPYTEADTTESSSSSTEQKKTSSNDYLDSVNVFGGSHQTIYSKNFKGGEITAVFGGCDVNLTQADFEGEIVIDVTAIFGGAKIIIPAGWEVKSEVTAIFGGLDDKRSIQPITDGKPRLLIIKGIAMFGGVDIRNY